MRVCGKNRQLLSNRGFWVVNHFADETADKFENELKTLGNKKELYGLYFVGHGYCSPGGIVLSHYDAKNATGADKYAWHSDFANWNPGYKLAIGLLYACYSAAAQDKFADGSLFVAFKYTMFPVNIGGDSYPALNGVLSNLEDLLDSYDLGTK